MSSLDSVVEVALDRGFNPDSRIIQMTHWDLDGYISVSNLMSYLNNPKKNLQYFSIGYEDIDIRVLEMIDDPDNMSFKNADFVLITDISVKEHVARLFQDVKEPTYIVLDHHETAFPTNIFPHIHVDETNTVCGSEVTLNFLKKCGYKSDNLDELNRIATNYDLWFWPKQETFLVEDTILTGIPDQLNRLFYTYGWKEKGKFAERWANGWGDGFTKEEADFIYKDTKKAIDYIKTLEFHDLTENIGFTVAEKYVNDIFAVIRRDYAVGLVYFPKKNKLSGRVADDCNCVNIGKIFQECGQKLNLVGNSAVGGGGGHAKAGGLNNIAKDKIESVIDHVVEEVEAALANKVENKESQTV